MSLSVFLFSEFDAKASVQTLINEAQTEESNTVNPATDTNASNNGSSFQNASTSATNSKDNTLMTEDEALSIAIPLIDQYATENNRTITNVTVTSGIMPDDGLRGGLTLQQALAENLTPSEARSQFSYYPVWGVVATFQWTQPQLVPIYAANGTTIGSRLPSEATWINRFSVLIWADTGQIASAEPQGVM